MPSPQHEALVAALQSSGDVAAPDLATQRAGYDAMLCANPLPADIAVTELTIGKCNADMISVANTRDAARVVLYLHGGGYVIGSNIGYREFGSRVSRATGARVLVLNYRLAPEHPFPAAVDDAVGAYQWLLQQGTAANDITIAGDSAGGGLTLATLLSLRDAGTALPGCGVCFSPWTDLEGTGDSAKPGAVDDPLVNGAALAGMSSTYASGQLRNPLASPLHGSLAGLPPLQIQVGTREVLLDDSTRLLTKAKAAGVKVDYFAGEGLVHVWPVLAPTAPESLEALTRMARFMRAASA